MGSITEISSSVSSTPLMPRRIVIVYDATKNYNVQDLKHIITHVWSLEEMINEVDTIMVLGVLDKILHPMGFQIQIGHKSFVGAHGRAIKEEVSRKVDANVGMLQHNAEECESKGVDIKVKIAVGAPMKEVVVQEIVDLNTTWAILDRQLRKELRFYLKHIPCKVAHVRDNLSLAILRSYYIDKSTDSTRHKLLYSLSKPVSPPPAQDNDNESDKHSVNSMSVSSPKASDIPNGSSTLSTTSRDIFLHDEFGSNRQQEISGNENEPNDINDESPQVMENEGSLQNHSEAPVVCTASEMKTGNDSVGCSYSNSQIGPDEFSSHISLREGVDAKVENEHNGPPLEVETQQKYPDTPGLDGTKMGLNILGCSYSNIQTATNNFSPDNFLGESGYGVVYKGRLEDGQFIAVKVLKESNTQDCAEFRSEGYSLSSARHTNVVTLLGYCCQENVKILIYEYMCYKSLDWHLFDNKEQVLEWRQRHAIAVGIAKGLRFLHEEYRGSPIVHRDVRPSNILLRHDFVPMLGDYGFSKWKMSKYDKQRRSLCSITCLAPEYIENGIGCVKTDVYSFGIVLLQLISGRKALYSTRDDHQQSIRQWALPLIETHALHELVDPCLGDSYIVYDLYNMARAACMCVRTKPAMRPTMGEVLSIIEGTNDHLRHVKSNLYPMILSSEISLS